MEKTGLYVGDDEALSVLEGGGAKVDRKTRTPVDSPECGLLNAAAPVLAQKYMLPSFSAGG